MFDRYANWLVQNRYVVVLFALAATVALTLGVRHIGLTSDYRAYFGETNPQRQAFEALQDTYTKSDNIIVAIAPDSQNVFGRDVLAALEWITEQSWQTPYSSRVDSLTNFQYTKAEQDTLLVGDLIEDATTLSEAQISQIRQVALQEPVLLNRLISPSGAVTGINIVVQMPGANPGEEIREVATFVRDLAAQIEERYPDLEAYLSGTVMMDMTFEEASKGDMSTLIPAMYIVVLVLLGILLRSATATLAAFLLLVFATAGAMGVAGWLRIDLTSPSSVAPIIILTIAVADSVHFLTTMLQRMRDGRSKTEAIADSLNSNMQPIFLTSLTTAIGFSTMNFGEVPPFADMGNIVVAGVVLAFLWSITLLPALMSILPVQASVVSAADDTKVDRLGRWISNHHRSLIGISSAVVIVFVSMIPRNDLNDVFIHYFDESFPFRTDTDFLSKNLTGMMDIHYSIGAGEPEGINDPGFLLKLEAFAEWYRTQPKVFHVNVITDTLKRLNRNFHGDDLTEYRLPTQRELAAQYLLFYELSLPYGLDLRNQINIDKSATRLSVVLDTASINEILSLERSAQAWLTEHGIPSMQTDGSSAIMMFAHIGERNIRAMLIAASLALVLISLLLVLALRSIRFGLISLVPNIVPVGVAFGFWALIDGEINIALSVVATITIGIVVDDTIHFMSKYLHAYRHEGKSPEEAVRYAFNTVGRALLVTTVVLVIGFLVLAQSHFKVNADLGLMSAMTIFVALIVDFFLLPPLLIQFSGSSKPKQ